MKKLVVIVLFSLLVYACSHKTIALSNPRINTENNSVKTTSETGTIAEGKTVYINRCARCHNLKPVEKYTAQEWEPILKTMIPKAHLNDTEAADVRAFVIANAKK